MHLGCIDPSKSEALLLRSADTVLADRDWKTTLGASVKAGTGGLGPDLVAWGPARLDPATGFALERTVSARSKLLLGVSTFPEMALHV